MNVAFGIVTGLNAMLMVALFITIHKAKWRVDDERLNYEWFVRVNGNPYAYFATHEQAREVFDWLVSRGVSASIGY